MRLINQHASELLALLLVAYTASACSGAQTTSHPDSPTDPDHQSTTTITTISHTSTSTPNPTSTATVTPLPTPDLDVLVLDASMLPGSVQDVALEDAARSPEELDIPGIEPLAPFVLYSTSPYFQFIMGFITYSPDPDGPECSMLLDNMQLISEFFVSGFGDAEIVSVEVAQETNDSGDEYIIQIIQVLLDGWAPARAESIHFCRDTINAFIWSYAERGEPWTISPLDIANLLDALITSHASASSQ